MSYEVALTYSESLVRYAVTRFWWRVVGVRFLIALVLLATCLGFFLYNGDTSWLVGAMGAVLVFGALFAVLIYVVHYRNSLHKLRAMGSPHAHLVASDDTLSFSSGAGLAALPWSSIVEVWQFPQCWLLLFSKAQFVTLPLTSVAPEARAFILQRVQSAGGKIG
ncbi:YcxB family protein [Rhodanobacter sp. 7MK24]|uniref:YcxB family protein n=1 Tax=Rhodanobacter sp. 7MK24 TaxID=2775922 RepID=UPI0017858A5B|nr:YcxB family protein [Rhodanobacter sp. 7MK24]MBD8879115.1 YcxB family protein [Rhodanobacter sp. 7MK24]